MDNSRFKRLRDQTRTIEFKAVREKHPPSGEKKAFLTVIRAAGSDLGLHRVVEGPVVLGRAPECDLPLQDLGISWHHACVSPRGNNAYVVEDLGSTNGTWVGSSQVKQPRPLREGEKIFLGETVVRFSLADEIDLGFQSEVTHLVSTDPLTGMESKARFDDALDYELELARRLKEPLAVLMMDMDGVKAINDQHGHLFGAHAIGETGRIIAKCIGDGGHACRFGGDEFTAFLPRLEKQAAVEAAEKIREAVERAAIEKDSIPLKSTISIGVATYPEDGEHVLKLVAAADRALYRAKAAGKNRVST